MRCSQFRANFPTLPRLSGNLCLLALGYREFSHGWHGAKCFSVSAPHNRGVLSVSSPNLVANAYVGIRYAYLMMVVIWAAFLCPATSCHIITPL